ncbi:MAG: Uma2 family endonuclease [Planctomycetaceae bacterium]|nr:Uma2 family endonuclease [Planctomycetaceae bacterium]
MMSTVATNLMTAREFAALDPRVASELIRGEVVEMPVPGVRHGVVTKNAVFLLEFWNRANQGRWLVGGEAGVITERDPDSVRGPDAFVISRQRVPGGLAVPGFLELPPEVCIEILSPNDVWKDVIAKVDEYLQAGVLEIWVIDPEERQIHVYQPAAAPRSLGKADELTSGVLDGFRSPASAFFHDIPDAG